MKLSSSWATLSVKKRDGKNSVVEGLALKIDKLSVVSSGWFSQKFEPIRVCCAIRILNEKLLA